MLQNEKILQYLICRLGIIISHQTYNLFSFALFAEQAEASHSIFDNALCNLLKKYEKAIECIHISDQYSGPRPPE